MDQRRLRLYERSKLRYYYAIITCDAAGEGLQWEAGRFAGLGWSRGWAWRLAASK